MNYTLYLSNRLFNCKIHNGKCEKYELSSDTFLLRNLKPHTASGPDGIPAKLLKITAEEISPALTLLFQASINQGRVPPQWKKGQIVPLFKKGSRSDPANYRPISLSKGPLHPSCVNYVNT